MKKCLLEGCNKPAKRKFCSNKHKDRWHNLHNPRGKFAHLNPKNHDRFDFETDEDLHPLSGEGLGQD